MFSYKKFLILSSVVSSCLLTLSGYKLSADSPKCYSREGMPQYNSQQQSNQNMSPASGNQSQSNQGMSPASGNQSQSNQGMSQSSGMENSYTQMQNRMNRPAVPGQANNHALRNHKGDMVLPSGNEGSVHDMNRMMPAKALRGDSTDRFSGKIKSVKKVTYPDGTQVHIVVDTDQGEMTVVLGPETYLNRQMVKLMTGDQIRVQGYRVTVNGDMVFMASEITKNGNPLRLRDANRQPLWRENPHNGQGQNSAASFWGR
ncbi:MAG: hypothetical protein WAM28_08345 [Chlamydiales bacterium]